QFLLKDIAPTAERMGFNVFYFSFMDDTGANVAADFQTALYHFAQSIRTGSGIKSFLGSLNKIDIMGIGIGRENKAETLPKISDIITSIAHDNAPTLLLLDEVQELARIKDTSGLIRSLRTGLDINQNRVKTIFTGSSTNGLKAMFNNSKAPFFHFAHALDFPLLGKEFTDFLADVYQKRTGKQADKAAFYTMFKRLNHTPMYMRAVVQDMIITPELSLEEAASSRLQQLNEQHAEKGIWAELKPIEQAILA
ncbi:selenocysteine synthase, partial [Neisseria arctica]